MKLLNNFCQLVDSQSDTIFFRGENYEVTFKELFYAVGGRTKALSGIGITHGLRVAIILDESRDYIEFLLSCWQLGAIPVLVPHRNTSAEKKRLLESSQPHIIITNWEILEELVDIDIPIFPIEELSQGFGGCVTPQLYNGTDLNDIRLILFTSGTTGRPKVVQLSERNLMESAMGWHEQVQFTQEDVYLNCLPMHHIGGISIFLRSLVHGFPTYQMDRFDIEKIAHLIQLEAITLISMVPTMLQRLLDKINNKLPHLVRGIILSGGLSSKKLMKRCISYNIPIYKSYGMTETSSGICGFWLHDYPLKYESVGLPFMKVKLNIIDSVLHVRGPTVMNGYFGEEPIKVWLDTGDYGEIDDEGFIYIDMHRTNRIVTGGENVNPKEVEEVLLRHPQIAAAKVYGEPDEVYGEIVVAEISSELQSGEINSWLKGKISNYKIPKVFYN